MIINNLTQVEIFIFVPDVIEICANAKASYLAISCPDSCVELTMSPVCFL